MADLQTAKLRAAELIADNVDNGTSFYAGTGSTADLVTIEIGKRLRDGTLEDVSALCTSPATMLVCRENAIRVLPAEGYDQSINFGFDGADEVDGELNLIKGGGAAMFREKIASEHTDGGSVIFVDDSKLCQSHLGERFPVPVEIDPAAYYRIRERLVAELGFTPDAISLRKHKPSSGKYGVVETSGGNWILDLRLPEKFDADAVLPPVKAMTGVIEHGYFPKRLVREVIVARGDGSVTSLKSGQAPKVLVTP